MTEANLKRNEDGSYYFEVSDQSDQYRRQVHPDTGTENDQMWPDVGPEDPLLPLLDFNQAWQYIRSGELIETDDPTLSHIDSSSIDERNAAIIARELKYHILATTEREPTSTPESDNDATNNSESQLKSVYGASILLKLQYQDRGSRKLVPHRQYEELGKFIKSVTSQLTLLKQDNPTAAKLTFDAIALELTPTLFARLLDGRETCTKLLEDASEQLLFNCAREANPREMHLAIRNFTRKIDSVYMEATSYLVLVNLIEIWGIVLRRVPRKRHALLIDFCSTINRMQPCAESYEISFVPDDGVGVEESGRIDRIPDALLDFYQGLVITQLEQYKENKTLNRHVDILGNVKEGMSELEIIEDKGKNEETVDADKKKKIAMVKDWVSERAVTRSQVLLLQTPLWRRLSDPPGEERNLPVEQMKKKKSARDVEKRKVNRKNEETLARCRKVVQELGWTSLVQVCQSSGKQLHLDTCSRAEEALYSHLPLQKASKKEKKYTLIGISSIGQYVCSVLRPRTNHLLSNTCSIKFEDVDDYKVDLHGSGLDLLTPEYAFDITLIYVMTIVAQPSIAPCMAGITTIRALLTNLPDDTWNTYDDVLRPRCGSRSQGVDASPLGLCHILMRTVGSLDDPLHRRVAYETLQLALSKIENPAVRYSVVENLFMECKRTVLLAQLVTELKDAMLYSNRMALDEKLKYWTETNASMIRSRFVHVVLPHFCTPRKEMLQHISGIVSTANAALLVVMVDKREIECLENMKTMIKDDDNETRDSVTEKDEKILSKDNCDDNRTDVIMQRQQRLKFVEAYIRIGLECARALGTVAHHDRNTMPNSALAKHSVEEAKAVYSASGRTLNQCTMAISAFDSALNLLIN